MTSERVHAANFVRAESDRYFDDLFQRAGRLNRAGRHTLDSDEIGTSHVAVAAPTFVEPADPRDVVEVRTLEGRLQIDARAATPRTHPDWDGESLDSTRGLLLRRAAGLQDPGGAATIHLGGDPWHANAIPPPEGWNHIVRLYRPGPEILDGSWTFPELARAPGTGSEQA